MSTLQSGSSGQEVKDLQNALNLLDVQPRLVVDGLFGPNTSAAVKTFQKRDGLPVDGIAGQNTISEIKRLLVAKGLATPSGGIPQYGAAPGMRPPEAQYTPAPGTEVKAGISPWLIAGGGLLLALAFRRK